MLRVIKKKLDNVQEQMSNASKAMETLRKNQKGMLEIKNSVTEIKNTFDGLIRRWDMAQERANKLEDMSIEISQTDIQREKLYRRENTTGYPRTLR